MKSHPLSTEVIYELYNKKGGDLIWQSNHRSEPKAEITVKINNPGQREQILKFPFRSYVSNFSRVIQNGLLNIDNSTAGAAINKIIKTTTGGTTYPIAAIHTMAVNEAALSSPTQTNYGIWIGDGDNLSRLGLTIESGVTGVLAYNDYHLRGLILADGGSPDTNVVYGVTNVVMSNSDNTLSVSRRFVNNNASDIKINEIGLVAKSGSDYFLIARDIITPLNYGVTTPYFLLVAGGTVEVIYSFTITGVDGIMKNYLKWISSEFLAANAYSQVIDTGNTAQTINFSSARTQKDILAASGNALYGIRVGIATANIPATANALTQNLYGVISPIGHGSTAMTLDHGVVVPITMTQGDNTTVFGLYRDFENKYTETLSGIWNTGLIIRQGIDPYTYYLIARDGLSFIANGPINVAPGQVLRVKYLLSAVLDANSSTASVSI